MKGEQQSPKKPLLGSRGDRARVYGAVLAVNLAVAALVYVYFAVIDVSTLSRFRFLRSFEFLLALLVPAAAALLLSRSYAAPLFEYLEVISRPGFQPLPETNGGGRIIHLRRRALRLPLFCGLAGFLGWVLGGILIAVRVWFSVRGLAGDASISAMLGPAAAGDVLSESLYLSASGLRRQWMLAVQSAKGMGMSMFAGAIAAAITFFAVESVWQKRLALFFPRGRLSAVADPWLIPVRYRLMAIFVLVGALPLVLMGVISYQRASAMAYLQPERVLGNLLLVNLFMVVFGVGLSALLAWFAARSVAEPLARLQEGMDRVSKGDLAVELPVSANDEIGRVTEGFNRMVKALAEQDASIRELTQGLEQKVKQRTEALEQAIKEKERTQAELVQSEKMAGLGQLVAGIAHELNNPLGFIYANAEHLERFLENAAAAAEKGDQEELRKNLERARSLLQTTREGARRAKQIVEGLRVFSRKSAGARKAVPLYQPLETALMLLSHELKKGVRVQTEVDRDLVVEADPGELAQVFVNIIMNALHAAGESGEIEIKLFKKEDRAAVEVRDNGPGIPEEHLARVFEPFFTTKPPGKGTGLGLAVAYGIVESHRGEIRAGNRPEGGAVFTVLLPLAAGEKG